MSVFENLFRNAIEHGSPDEQTASGEAVAHDSSASRTGSDAADTDLTVDVTWTGEGFAVTDDGVGIDDSVADEVFERGVSEADSGTGYGLAIVEDILEAHGWEISLDTDVDGTRFVVSGVETAASDEP